MAFTERLALLITGDASGAVREFQKVGNAAEKDLGKAHNNLEKIGGRLQIGGAAAVGFAAVAGKALFGFAKASEEAKLSSLKLDNTLQNAPKLANANKKAFTDLASAIAQKTVADDDSVIAAEAMLGTFNQTQDQILGITPLVVDYARKFGVDLVDASVQVGKALDGNRGALARNGVSIDEAAFKADRFSAVQKALREQVGGFAEAEGKTFSGRLEILKNQLGEVQEGIGAGVVDAVSSAIDPVTKLSGKFADLDEGTQHLIGGLATIGTTAVGAIGGLSFLAGTVAKMRDRFLKDPTAGFAGGLNNFGKAAGVAAAAAGILGAAYVAMQQDAQRTQRGVDNLTDAVKRNGSTIGEEAGNVLAQWIGKNKDAAEAARDLHISVQDLNKAVQGSKDDFDAVQNPIKDYVKHMQETGHGQDDATQSALDLIDAIAQQRKEFEGAKTQTLATNDATKKLKDTSLDATTAQEALGEKTADTTDNIKDEADKAKEAEDALKKWTDAVYGSRDAQRQLDDSLLGLTDDTNEYNDKAKEAAKHGFKNAEANAEWQKAANKVKGDIDQVAKSAGELATQQAALYGKTLSASDAAAYQRDALIRMRDTISPNSPFRAYLDQLIAQLDNAARTRDGYLHVNVSVQGDAAARIALAKLGGRAKGGPVSAGEPYIVGEEGPEVFVPKQSGTIVPNRKTSQFRPVGSSAGNTAVINVAINNPSGNGDQIGDQLLQSLKSGRNAAELRRVLAGV